MPAADGRSMLTLTALRPWFNGFRVRAGDAGLLGDLPVYALLTAGGLFLGFLREITVASTFGLGAELDVFVTVMGVLLFFGVQIGNAIETVFISKVAPLGKAEAWSCFWKAGRSLMAANLLILSLLIALPGVLLPLIFPAFSPEQNELGVHLIRMLLLPIVFANTAGLARAALAVTGTFAPGFMAGSIVSLCTIGSILLLTRYVGIDSLVWGVALGHLLVLAFYAFQLRKTGSLVRPSGEDKPGPARFPLWKAISTVLVVELLYLGLVLTERSFAADLGAGTIAAFFYAGAIVAVPVSLLAFPMTTTLFPRMARLFASNRAEGVALLKQYGSATIVVSSLIVAVIVWLARPIVELLFVRGRFSTADAEITAQILSTLVLALPFMSVYGLIRNAFYSISDYGTPVYGMTVQWCALAVGGSLFIPSYGVQGLALASVVAQGLHTLMLGWLLTRKCSGR